MRENARSSWVMLPIRSVRRAIVQQVLMRAVRPASPQEFTGIVGIGPDRADRLVDLVGHAGHHLPQQRELVGLDQFVLHFMQARLGPAAFLDLVSQPFVGMPQLVGARADLGLERIARGQ
ncbi:hypothetical protein [Castellaniella ginsengisoli]|uniref:hypothetical protein n=1 Tax=Castellaniella ginsengisoli TaxID=546114 RepID=UPI0034CEF448